VFQLTNENTGKRLLHELHTSPSNDITTLDTNTTLSAYIQV